MGPVCSKSNVAVAPVPLDTNVADTPVAKLETEINIIWLGEKNVSCLSTLHRQYNQVYVFDKLNDSIEMINSLPLSNCNCIYIIYDNFANKENLSKVINNINHLKQICAIYIYYEDKNILHSHPSICTVSNANHLATQIKMVMKHLGALPIIDGTIANTIDFDGEDMRLEVHENTFNALFKSIEEYKFILNEEQLLGSNNNTAKKDKQNNVTGTVEFVVSNMNISLEENGSNTPTNTVYIMFTATVKATITSVSIPLGIRAWVEVRPGLSRTSAVKGNAVIIFNSKKNTFEIEASTAIAANIDLVIFNLKDFDVAKYIPPYVLPGPVNLSQAIPIPNNNPTTTDEFKPTHVTIVDFKMWSQQKRIVLSLNLNYRTSSNKPIC